MKKMTEKEYSVDENDWNDDFMYELKNDLDANFSIEKLELYSAVVKQVLQDKVRVLEQESEEYGVRNQEIIENEDSFNVSLSKFENFKN